MCRVVNVNPEQADEMKYNQIVQREFAATGCYVFELREKLKDVE